MRKNRGIKLDTTKRRRNYLVSESNDHATKFFTKYILAMVRKKRRYIWINLFRTFNTRINKILIYDFWYNYVKLQYDEKPDMWFVYIFIVYIKTGDI